MVVKFSKSCLILLWNLLKAISCLRLFSIKPSGSTMVVMFGWLHILNISLTAASRPFVRLHIIKCSSYLSNAGCFGIWMWYSSCWVFDPLVSLIPELVKWAHSIAWVLPIFLLTRELQTTSRSRKLFAWERKIAQSWRCRVLFGFDVFPSLKPY